MTLHVGTLSEVETKLLRPATDRRSPNWGAFLSRPIALADGERILERLWDAADVLHGTASSTAEYQLSQNALVHAAQTGGRADILQATEHLESFLRTRALM